MSENTYEFPDHCAPQLVPASAFNQNLRAILTKKQWQDFRQKVFIRHGKVCAYCGACPKKLDCHEIWKYQTFPDTENGNQILVKVLPLCTKCHQVCHIGFWSTQGPTDEITKHMAKVRKISVADAKAEIAAAFSLHNHLSAYYWILDVSAAKQYI
jgi:hypothetical protein